MKRICYLFVFLSISLAFSADPECPPKSWKISSMEFSPNDPYLVTVLGFSYGPEVRKFIPKLSGAISRYYYEGSDMNSKFTFFSTYFANNTDADEAFRHMQNRVKGAELQRVSKKEKEVVWFAGRGISKECFYKVLDLESKKLGHSKSP